MSLGPLNKFHHDKEIAREIHGDDNVKFGFQTLLVDWAFLFSLLFIWEEEFKSFLKSLMGLHSKTVSS